MRKGLIAFAFFFLGFAATFANAMDPNVLIFGKTIRHAHAAIIPEAGLALVDLLTKNGFNASFIQDADALEKAALNDYQSLILLDVCDGVLNASAKKAIEAFFNQGGSIIGIHASLVAGRDWPWFKGLVGASFLDDTEIESGRVQVVNTNHPANKGLPVSWIQKDEWYNFSSQIDPAVTILAIADETTFKGGKMGPFHPIIWGRESVKGKGRFWYTALGHPLSLYHDQNGVFPKMILQAVRWSSER